MAAIFQTAFSNAFFLNENLRISIKISLNFVPKGSVNNIPAHNGLALTGWQAIIWTNDA